MAPPIPPPDPDRFDEAVRAFRARVPMTDDEFDELVEAEQERAFYVAGVSQARVVQQVMDALDKAIEDGTTLDEFKADVGSSLSDSWGGDDPGRLETVFRTNVMTAYNDGRQAIFDDPAVQEARPYLRFDATEDSRTSDICDALNGKVLPADSTFWNTHRPPLHHNCRSILTPLTEDEAKDEGITAGHPDTKGAKPDPGFGGTAEPEDAKPDFSAFDPDVSKILRDRLND